MPLTVYNIFSSTAHTNYEVSRTHHYTYCTSITILSIGIFLLRSIIVRRYDSCWNRYAEICHNILRQSRSNRIDNSGNANAVSILRASYANKGQSKRSHLILINNICCCSLIQKFACYSRLIMQSWVRTCIWCNALDIIKCRIVPLQLTTINIHNERNHCVCLRYAGNVALYPYYVFNFLQQNN